MSQLVDWQIIQEYKISEANNNLLVTPWDEDLVQPASLDLRLGRELRNEHGLAWHMHPDAFEDMEPGRFVLGHTQEYIRMPSDMCGRVEGKSTIGRQGLAVHVTAGFIDPGFHGQITLELKFQGTLRHMKLWPGMRIAQITFHQLGGIPHRLYGDPLLGSHYQGQLGATPPAK